MKTLNFLSTLSFLFIIGLHENTTWILIFSSKFGWENFFVLILTVSTLIVFITHDKFRDR